MIPISPDQVLNVKDPDGHKITYHLRYLLDKKQPDFLKMHNELENSIKAFIPAATKKIESIKGKKWEKGEKDKDIRNEASRLLFEKIQESPDKFITLMNEWIDLFIAGWTGDEPSMVQYPKDNKPSRCFLLNHKFNAFGMVMEHLEELCTLPVETMQK